MRRSLLSVSLAVLSVVPAFAAGNPLAGTWKLDAAKSHFTGTTFTYSKLPNGMMHYTNGGSDAYDFGTDGKDYTALYGSTVTVSGKDADHWTETWKFNGKVMSVNTNAISADGKTMMTESKGTKPDGETFDDMTTYTRESGSHGPEGKWKSTKVTVSAPGMNVLTFNGDVLKWEIPDYKETFEGKTDGSDVVVTGPELPPGMTLAIKKVSDHELRYTVKASGKVIAMGIYTALPDGKAATDVSWSAGKESEKQTAYFVKQ